MDGIFESQIKGKPGKNVSGLTIKEAYQNATKTPQAVIKISGFSKDQKKLQVHIKYISRAGKLKSESANKDSLDFQGMKEKIDHWTEHTKNRKNGRIAMKIILSAPEGSSVKGTTKAIDHLADTLFGDNHDYFYVIHTDTKHPHGHLVVKVQGYDGKNLNPKKKDLELWRKKFAEKLRENGIKATATRRASRGVTKKSDKMAVVKLRERKKIPKVDKAILNDAVTELKGKKIESPWKEKINKTHQDYKTYYMKIGEDLINTKDEKAIVMGEEIKKYGEQLPESKTRREEYKEQLMQNAKDNKKERGHDKER
jgi:hypothetical protein